MVSTRTNYVKSLEERLRKTESLLRAAGLLDDEDISQLDSGGEDGNDNSGDESDIDHTQNEPCGSRGRDCSMLTSKDSIHVANEQPNVPSGSGLSSMSAGWSQKLPWDSTLHQPPLFRYDPREDSRYYGTSDNIIPLMLFL